MVDPRRPQPGGDLSDEEQFRRTIDRKQARKLQARRRGDRGPWFWLGMFGLVGWSVAIPTVIGIAVGVWLDRTYPGPISWTLTMLIVGAAIGCWTAWFWVKRESERRD